MPGTGHSVGPQGRSETEAVFSGACEKRGISPEEMGLSLSCGRGSVIWDTVVTISVNL